MAGNLARDSYDPFLATFRSLRSLLGMPVIRFIITSLAVIAGLIGAFALVVIGSVAFIGLRLFGRPAVRPRFQRRAPTTPTRPAYSSRDDVIDVVATEVKE